MCSLVILNKWLYEFHITEWQSTVTFFFICRHITNLKKSYIYRIIHMSLLLSVDLLVKLICYLDAALSLIIY